MTDPIDHKQLVASIPPGEWKALNAKSDVAGLAHLAVHGGLIVALGVWIALAAPYWQWLLPIQGMLIIFLFALMHECAHRTPFATSWINDSVAGLCGFVLFLPPEWFRFFHFAHHRHTNDPEKDPELAAPKPATLGAYLWTVSGVPIWRWQLGGLVGNALGRGDRAYVPAAARPMIRREARWMLAGYSLLLVLSLALRSDLLLWVWILPALLGQPLLRLYLLTEHGRCPLVSNMLENSRTTFTTWAVRKLAWNMPFHAEHHSAPSVPFHKLPALHRIAKPHLQVTERGYARFHRKFVSSLDA